jgi:hypothetical protein
MRTPAILASVCLLLGGCAVGELGGISSTKKHGKVGDTLTDGAVRVTLLRVAPRVRPPSDDITGLSTPGPGMRFFGAKVKACGEGQAIGTFAFRLARDGGGDVEPKFPEHVIPGGFDSVRTGCARGWLVFELPRDSQATQLKFKYDDTGSARPDGKEKHARFTWSVGARR